LDPCELIDGRAMRVLDADGREGSFGEQGRPEA
jgi:hypothetical protein